MIIFGIQGTKGSFNEEACIRYCELNRINEYKIEYLITADNVLKKLKKKEIDIGIFCIENDGLVLENLKVMGKYTFNVLDVFTLEVNLSLLTLPSKKKENIKYIASYSHALQQCDKYLSKYFPKAKKIFVKDTALAANQLVNGNLPKRTAIIASKNCGKIYNLVILNNNIQDTKPSIAHFLIVKSYE